jgi:tellurite resistance protein TerC
MITTLATTTSAVTSYDVPWFMYAAIIAALAVYAIIEYFHSRHDHAVGFREAIKWSVIYISAALLFTIPVYFFIAPQAAAEYLAAWSIEKALSLDNLFVFGMIFASFKVEQKYRKRILNYGIAGAIFFRLLFILAGYELLKQFSWIGIIFGFVLLNAAWQAFQHARHGHESEKTDMRQSRLWKALTRILPIHSKFDGVKLTTVVGGKRMLTLMAGIIILIELTDVVFAIDSVPAVLAVSPDRYIAYASNVFAILGLRSLFFVYDAVADRFWALNWALAAILLWIGIKMMIVPFGVHPPIALSLGILFVLLSGGIGVSLALPRHTSNHS